MIARKSNQKAVVASRIFVGGVPVKMEESKPAPYPETLRDHFSAYGQVSYFKLARNKKTKEALGFGFLEFANESVSQKVLSLKHMIHGREVCRCLT